MDLGDQELGPFQRKRKADNYSRSERAEEAIDPHIPLPTLTREQKADTGCSNNRNDEKIKHRSERIHNSMKTGCNGGDDTIVHAREEGRGSHPSRSPGEEATLEAEGGTQLAQQNRLCRQQKQRTNSATKGSSIRGANTAISLDSPTQNTIVGGVEVHQCGTQSRKKKAGGKCEYCKRKSSTMLVITK